MLPSTQRVIEAVTQSTSQVYSFLVLEIYQPDYCPDLQALLAADSFNQMSPNSDWMYTPGPGNRQWEVQGELKIGRTVDLEDQELRAALVWAVFTGPHIAVTRGPGQVC